jgi:hypothetical protein
VVFYELTKLCSLWIYFKRKFLLSFYPSSPNQQTHNIRLSFYCIFNYKHTNQSHTCNDEWRDININFPSYHARLIWKTEKKQGTKFVSLADYTATGNSEVSMKEGDVVELRRVGCAGWWFIKVNVLGKCFILSTHVFLNSCHFVSVAHFTLIYWFSSFFPM